MSPSTVRSPRIVVTSSTWICFKSGHNTGRLYQERKRKSGRQPDWPECQCKSSAFAGSAVVLKRTIFINGNHNSFFDVLCHFFHWQAGSMVLQWSLQNRADITNRDWIRSISSPRLVYTVTVMTYIWFIPERWAPATGRVWALRLQWVGVILSWVLRNLPYRDYNPQTQCPLVFCFWIHASG